MPERQHPSNSSRSKKEKEKTHVCRPPTALARKKKKKKHMCVVLFEAREVASHECVPNPCLDPQFRRIRLAHWPHLGMFWKVATGGGFKCWLTFGILSKNHDHGCFFLWYLQALDRVSSGYFDANMNM